MNDNPNWATLLEHVPAEFHPMIKPVLAEWDRGVAEKINSLHKTYEPYKDFVENKVDPGIIDQALDLYGQLSTDPAKFLKRVDEVMDLKLVNPPQTQQVPNTNTGDFDLGDEFEGVDITKHPAFKQLTESLEKLQNDWSKAQQETEEERKVREFEEFLDNLEEETKETGGINRTFITALMSQGVNADDAVKQYHDLIAGQVGNDPNVQEQLQNVQQGQGENTNGSPTPPNVMGSSGTAGGGLPNEAISPSDLNEDQLQKMVADMLKADAEGG